MPKLMSFEEDGSNGCRVGKLGHSVLTFTRLLAGIFPDEAFLDEPCHKCRVCCTTLQSTGTCHMKLKLVLNNLRWGIINYDNLVQVECMYRIMYWFIKSWIVNSDRWFPEQGCPANARSIWTEPLTPKKHCPSLWLLVEVTVNGPLCHSRVAIIISPCSPCHHGWCLWWPLCGCGLQPHVLTRRPVSSAFCPFVACWGINWSKQGREGRGSRL